MLGFLEKVNRAGSPLMLLFLLTAGIYLSIGTGFFQFRHFGDMLKETFDAFHGVLLCEGF